MTKKLISIAMALCMVFSLTVFAGAEVTYPCTSRIDTHIMEGTYVMNINGSPVGAFTFTADGSKWTVQDADGQYLTFNYSTGGYALSDQPFSWSYNGGLYTTYWFNRHYLNWNGTDFFTSKVPAVAAIQVTETYDDHNWFYDENGYGVCSRLGCECVCSDHDDNGNGLCDVCGAVTDSSAATDFITVNAEIKTKSTWLTKKVTWNGTITVAVEGQTLQSVAYSMDEGGTWTTGTSFSQKTQVEVDDLLIKVTTNLGESIWYYDDVSGFVPFDQ